MNILKSSVASQNFQLPFKKMLATYLSSVDYANLVEARALGDKTAFQLEPKDARLMPEEYRDSNRDFDKIAAMPCTWCGLADNNGAPRTPGHFWAATYKAQVLPKSSDGVYVFDGRIFLNKKSEIEHECFKTNRKMTDADFAEVYRARAQTIMPITKYCDDFEVPVVIVVRRLFADELIPLP